LLDFVSKRYWFFLLSGLIILAGIIALGVSGLNLGMEFSSGSTTTLFFEKPVEQGDLRTALADLGHSEAIIQRSTQDAFLVQGLVLSTDSQNQLINDLQAKFNTTVRIAEFSPVGNETTGNETSANATLAIMLGKTVALSDLGNVTVSSGNVTVALGDPRLNMRQTILDSYLIRTSAISMEKQVQMTQALQQKFGPLYATPFDTISPVIAAERVRYNIYAIIAAAAAILLYMAWAFRKLASPFRYGTCAIIALLHDVLIMLAVFAIFRIEVDSMFIIAILTIIGFGVNNVIVVFDRLRDPKSMESRLDLDGRVNMGITETITRSINTSLTVLFTLFALYAFGGSTIHNFMLALIVGIIASTYSSLFIAGQLLVSWERGDFGKLFRWFPIRRQQS
jgi:preprotein translocase subunit SecF